VSPVYVALVHHPVRDRAGETMTAAVTNIDVHDIARSTHTFGLAGLFIVSPIEAQRRLVVGILEHWRSGAGRRRMPHRSEALAICQPAESIEAAVEAITAREGQRPKLLATAARAPDGRSISTFSEVSRQLQEPGRGPSLILFGTGHGLAEPVLLGADTLIEPIHGAAGYNHLSVRAAAAIVLDRLFGRS
jgi:hypothetical protein